MLCQSSYRSQETRTFIVLAMALIVGGIQSGNVKADLVYTYTYTGNNFAIIDDSADVGGSYDTSMSVSGWFILQAALAPNLSNQAFLPDSWSFHDGRNTLVSGMSYSSNSFTVSTDNAGQITFWRLDLTTNLNDNRIQFIQSFNSPDLGVFADLGAIAPAGGNADSGRINNSPGSWAITAVPEPGFMTVMILAAGGAVGWRRSRQHRGTQLIAVRAVFSFKN